MLLFSVFLSHRANARDSIWNRPRICPSRSLRDIHDHLPISLSILWSQRLGRIRFVSNRLIIPEAQQSLLPSFCQTLTAVLPTSLLPSASPFLFCTQRVLGWAYATYCLPLKSRTGGAYTVFPVTWLSHCVLMLFVCQIVENCRRVQYTVVFWIVIPRKLVCGCRHFGGKYCFLLQSNGGNRSLQKCWDPHGVITHSMNLILAEDPIIVRLVFSTHMHLHTRVHMHKMHTLFITRFPYQFFILI